LLALKEKDRVIRQLKGERDTLYEELKGGSVKVSQPATRSIASASHKSVASNPFQNNQASSSMLNSNSKMLNKVFTDI
jgi:hypothetical protein